MNSPSSIPMSRLHRLKNRMREKKYTYHPFQQGQVKSTQPILAHRIKRIRFSSLNCSARAIGRILSCWWLEFLSCAFVIIAFVGIVTVLYNYQDQPLPTWPHGLSINTVLSVLGIVLRGPFCSSQERVLVSWNGDGLQGDDFSVICPPMTRQVEDQGAPQWCSEKFIGDILQVY